MGTKKRVITLRKVRRSVERFLVCNSRDDHKMSQIQLILMTVSDITMIGLMLFILDTLLCWFHFF